MLNHFSIKIFMSEMSRAAFQKNAIEKKILVERNLSGDENFWKGVRLGATSISRVGGLGLKMRPFVMRNFETGC